MSRIIDIKGTPMASPNCMICYTTVVQLVPYAASNWGLKFLKPQFNMSCDNSHWQILLKNCPTIWGVFFEKNNLKFDFIASKSLVEKYFFLYTSNFKDVHLKKILYLYRNFPIKFDFIFHNYTWFPHSYIKFPTNITIEMRVWGFQNYRDFG